MGFLAGLIDWLFGGERERERERVAIRVPADKRRDVLRGGRK